MPPLARPFVALLLYLLILPQASAETFTGRVVKVVDGDTLDVLVDGRTEIRVRLAGIDAPESGQAWGTSAKQKLLDLVGGKVVEVESHKIDVNKRPVGKITLNGQDVDLAMIEAGLAWWYQKYASEQTPADRVLYEAAERQAKAERRGLWRDPDPMPPWEWRHRPPPAEGYAAACPCGSGAICEGPKGGRFCVTPEGKKRYMHGD